MTRFGLETFQIFFFGIFWEIETAFLSPVFFYTLHLFLQAAFHRGVLRTRDLDESELSFGSGSQSEQVEQAAHFEIPYVYFGIFDGHAGSATAVTAANELHQVTF